jgi:hypothetical protein
MTRKWRGMRACRVCGDPSQRAVCSKCSPRRQTTEHQDKYSGLRPAEHVEPGSPLGGFPPLPQGF